MSEIYADNVFFLIMNLLVLILFVWEVIKKIKTHYFEFYAKILLGYNSK